MKTKLLSGIALSAVVTALSVATPERAQAQYSWTGAYVGGFVGGAWGRSKTNTVVDCNADPGFFYICNSGGGGLADVAAVSAAGTGKISGSGFTGGIQAGYLWRSNNTVYGVETDFGAFNLSGTRRATGTIFGGTVPFTYTTSFNTDWLWTLRGRAGWLVQPNLLAYATGGLAVTRLGMSFAHTDGQTPPATGAGRATSTKTGWTVGGGLEWALNKNWSVKGEYLYLDFGSVTASGPIGLVIPGLGAYFNGVSTSADLTAHIARIGANYKF